MEETGPTGAVISTDLRCLGSVPLLQFHFVSLINSRAGS